jgi:hypothetical protein
MSISQISYGQDEDLILVQAKKKAPQKGGKQRRKRPPQKGGARRKRPPQKGSRPKKGARSKSSRKSQSQRFLIELHGQNDFIASEGIHFLPETPLNYNLLGALGYLRLFPLQQSSIAEVFGAKAFFQYSLAIPKIETTEDQNLAVKTFQYKVSPSFRIALGQLTLFVEPVQWFSYSHETESDGGFSPLRNFAFSGLSGGLPIQFSQGPFFVRLENQYHYAIKGEGDITYDEAGNKSAGNWNSASGYSLDLVAGLLLTRSLGLTTSFGWSSLKATLIYDLFFNERLSEVQEVDFKYRVMYVSVGLLAQI